MPKKHANDQGQRVLVRVEERPEPAIRVVRVRNIESEQDQRLRLATASLKKLWYAWMPDARHPNGC